MRSPTAPRRPSGRPERSALDGLTVRPETPSLSLIVPLLDEAEGLDHLVDDILAQDYPGLCEIWFVDGGSRDGTRERLDALWTASGDARVRVLANPRRCPASALNLGLARATGTLVMRLDAHARYASDTVRLCVEALLRTGAAGVGTLARPAPAPDLVGRAIVAVHRSPLGIGVAKFRRADAEGWAPTIWNGCYWRFVVDRVGPLREDLARAEDNDFNARIRALGYGLYVTPAPRAAYRVRRSLPALARQYRANGRAVVGALFESPGAIGPHHLAPLALVAGGLVLAGASLLAPGLAPAALACLLAYLGLLIGAACWAWRSERGLHLLLVPATLALLHLSYGTGSLLELGRRARTSLRTHRPRTARPMP